jgi:hypothetical protein
VPGIAARANGQRLRPTTMSSSHARVSRSTAEEEEEEEEVEDVDDDDDEVLKERRSPRERGRMGTSGDDAPVVFVAVDRDDDGPAPADARRRWTSATATAIASDAILGAARRRRRGALN